LPTYTNIQGYFTALFRKIQAGIFQFTRTLEMVFSQISLLLGGICLAGLLLLTACAAPAKPGAYLFSGENISAYILLTESGNAGKFIAKTLEELREYE
jgi:hypothetical protein